MRDDFISNEKSCILRLWSEMHYRRIQNPSLKYCFQHRILTFFEYHTTHSVPQEMLDSLFKQVSRCWKIRNYFFFIFGLVYETILLRFPTTSLSYIKDLTHSRYPVWLLQSLCPVVHNVFWYLGTGVILRISNWVWPPHGCLFSAFWPIVGFCSGFHLLQKEASLIERNSCTCLRG